MATCHGVCLRHTYEKKNGPPKRVAFWDNNTLYDLRNDQVICSVIIHTKGCACCTAGAENGCRIYGIGLITGEKYTRFILFTILSFTIYYLSHSVIGLAIFYYQ